MNINELLDELNKRKIHLTGRAISRIWEMDETSFSKKKKEGTQIKQKNILQLEKVLGIKLIKEADGCENTLERCYNPDIKQKRRNAAGRILLIKQKNGLSDIQMQGLLDITELEFNDIMDGRKDIDIKIIDNLKQNFKVSIDWLLYGG